MDFSRYQPPGVYVRDETTPVSQPLDLALPTAVAILGPSRGFRTHTETVALDGTTPVALARQGVNHSTVVVRSFNGGTTYILTDDYTVSGSEDADSTSTVVRVETGDIDDGELVTVSYQYADEAFFTPQTFEDLESVEGMYGRSFDPDTGTVGSPLSMAARIALENGALQVTLIDVGADNPENVAPSEIADALSVVASDMRVGMVVPLPVGTADIEAVGTSLRTHVATTAAERLFRFGVLGYEEDIITDAALIADSIEHERVILAYPNRLSYYNGATNSTVQVAGYYLAAAYAGQFIRNGWNSSLTRKRIRGFAGLPGAVVSELTRSVRNTLSSSGVAVAELSRNERLVCRHGVSTDMSNVITREPSVTRGRDAMLLRVEGALEQAQLVGAPITRDLPLQVKGTVAGALERSVEDQTIVSYRDLAVRQLSEVDPTIIQVKFEYRPTYPLNYILIVFAVDIQTGEVDLEAQGVVV